MKLDDPPSDRKVGACVASLRAATAGLERLSPVALSSLARAAAGFVRAAKQLRRRRASEGKRREAARREARTATASPASPAFAPPPAPSTAASPARAPSTAASSAPALPEGAALPSWAPGSSPSPGAPSAALDRLLPTGRRSAGPAAASRRGQPRTGAQAPTHGASQRLGRARRCYACRAAFCEAHFFYGSLCPPCATHNFAKRMQTANLRGRVALVTGARITSGHETALKLLRAGATVIGTTRFPRDAAERFGAERDFGAWSRRLHLYGLDFRVPGWVEAFAEHVAASFDRLDVLINNAAQTVRRPAPFYAHLVAGECAPAGDVEPRLRPTLAAGRDFAAGQARARGLGAGGGGSGLAALLSQVPVLPDDLAVLGPAGGPALVGAAIDAREANSWAQRLGDVAGAECLEALLVNAAAPFLLSGGLRPLMARDALAAKWVVNVAAVEGQFSRRQKDDRHPHLNMAKAALNMLTRSSAEGFARDRIFMNSVDVGWFSNGEPARVADAMRARGFALPLDATDAAARVCDPVFSGVLTGVNVYGRLLKDYRPVDW